MSLIDTERDPLVIRFCIQGLPEAEAAWAFKDIHEARSMAHFTLRQAMLEQNEPAGVAQIFDFERKPLGFMSAIIHDDSEHWAWKDAAHAPKKISNSH